MSEQKKPSDSAKEKREMRKAYSLYGTGIEFIVAMLLPGALGWWLDGKFGTRPWLMIALGVLGFVVGLRNLLRAVNR